MSRKITATITVEGDEASLASYRRRVNELLDVEREDPIASCTTRSGWSTGSAAMASRTRRS